jgi:hypothetical protein
VTLIEPKAAGDNFSGAGDLLCAAQPKAFASVD